MCVWRRYADFKRNVAFKFTGKERFNIFFSPILFPLGFGTTVESSDKEMAHPEDKSEWFVLKCNFLENDLRFNLLFSLYAPGCISNLKVKMN